MRAVCWSGRSSVEVRDVPEPRILEPTDAIVRITATGVCGSDLHLYQVLWPVMRDGDVIGHEGVGVVEEVGPEVEHIRPGDRVVVPFNIACGRCSACRAGLQSQCLTTQVTRFKKGARMFGYTAMYGAVPGAQAEYLRVPQAQYGPIPAPEGVPDERLVLLADVLPTAWQGVEYADIPRGGSVAVFGLGPIGQMASRIALHRGAKQVIGVDRVVERRQMAQRHGVVALEPTDDVADTIREMTSGLGADAVIDAVGMEAAGSPVDRVLQTVKLQPDRLWALRLAIDSLRRGGTLSVLGVYVGWYPFFPLGDFMDRQLTLRAGQANVRRWSDQILPLLTDPSDPLATGDLITHVAPLEEAPRVYEVFQSKRDGMVKPILRP